MCQLIEKSNLFVYKYQAFVTLFAYIWKFKLTLHMEEPECKQLVIQLCKSLLELIQHCNLDTIQLPIEGLNALACIDQSITPAITELIILPILQLFEKYHADGMLTQDILKLIKNLGNQEDNQKFREHVLP